MLNPRKCEAVNISNKRSPITFEYSIESHIVSWSQKAKYLGVIINSKLKWKDDYQFIVSKATKCLNHIHRARYGCTQAAKVNAYKALVRPHSTNLEVCTWPFFLLKQYAQVHHYSSATINIRNN